MDLSIVSQRSPFMLYETAKLFLKEYKGIKTAVRVLISVRYKFRLFKLTNFLNDGINIGIFLE